MKRFNQFNRNNNCTAGFLSGCKIAVGFLVFFMNVLVAVAQPVSVRAYTDKNKILLGEPLLLTLEVKSLNNADIAPFKVDSIPHFEFLMKDSSATIKSGDTSIFRQYYQLASFDSGQWVIPPFTFRPFVKTNSILIDVAYTEGFDPKQPYHDIQKIKDVKYKLEADVEKWWYPIALLLILITLLIYWITEKRKEQPMVPKIVPGNAYKKALEELNQLKNAETDGKKYYAQLVEIFRTYVLERTGISSLQQTSNNLIEKLQPLFSDDIKYDSLSQVLFLCDFVKFAKYNPEEIEAASAFEVIESSVHYIETELKKPVKKKEATSP